MQTARSFFSHYPILGLVVAGRAIARDQRGVARRRAVGVHGLDGVDEHARNVIARLENPQRDGVHLLQRVDLVRRARVAHASLHAVPPPVIGAAEADDVRAARVVPREPDGLHHRLGARHMERHLVHVRRSPAAPHVVGDDGVIAAEHEP